MFDDSAVDAEELEETEHDKEKKEEAELDVTMYKKQDQVLVDLVTFSATSTPPILKSEVVFFFCKLLTHHVRLEVCSSHKSFRFSLILSSLQCTVRALSSQSLGLGATA